MREEFATDFQSYNGLTYQIIGAVFEVHRALGPGLLENTYEACLAYELTQRGIQVSRQVAQPVIYHGVQLEVGYRLDLLVEQSIILEVKSVIAIVPIHQAQLMTYLKLTGLRLGFLLNFNVVDMKKGISRYVM